MVIPEISDKNSHTLLHHHLKGYRNAVFLLSAFAGKMLFQSLIYCFVNSSWTEVIQLSPLKALSIWLDKTLSNLIRMQHWPSSEQDIGLEIFQSSFPPEWFYYRSKK